MPHQLLIDASLYKEHNCIHKVKNILLDGRQDKVDGFKLAYGTAYHKFAASYHSFVDYNISLVQALASYSRPEIQAQIGKDWRTASHLRETIELYAEKYHPTNDPFQLLKDSAGAYITEARFQYPYRRIGDYEIILCGTIDAPCTYYNEYTLCDHKTTAIWDSEAYLKRYKLSPQLKMYKFIVDKIADLYPTTFGMFKGTGAFINGVFIQREKREFRRSEVFHYSNAEMIVFESNLNRFIDYLLFCIQHGEFPKNDTMCEASPYGLCKFIEACMAEDVVSELIYLERDFTVREYNPMMHGEV